MEQTIQPEHVTIPDPKLQQAINEPKGVIRKNLKVWIFLGACAVVVTAGLISNWTKKGSSQSVASQHAAPQPALQDNTDNNVQDLKNQLAAERQREAQAAAAQAAQMNAAPTMMGGSPIQPGVVSGLSPATQMGLCVPGQPCQQQGVYAQPQVSPEQQQAQQLAARERELAYNARFASNLVYARSNEAQVASRQDPNQSLGNEAQTAVGSHSEQPLDSSLVSPKNATDTKSTSQGSPAKRSAEINIDSAAGQPYVIYEGLTMDTILMNRLDGDAPGPVKVMVSSPVYSHDHQHVLIPDGSVVLGDARKIGSNGFGQQRRMAVVFHRMIMPDGYSVDLDQFHGLDQIGEEGLNDKVNNHYFEIFGTSIALGVISGAGQIAAGGGTITTNGSQAFTTGAASSVSQSATTVLDRFIQIPPTITIREGHRIKVYFTQDILLPAYENHMIPQTF